MMRRPLAVLAVSAVLGGPAPVLAAGISTGDIAALTQLQQQLRRLQDQFSLLKQQYAAVTGGYGRGATGLARSVNAASLVPGSWQDVVAQQQSGAFASRQAYYEKLINKLPQDLFAVPQGQGVISCRMSTDSVRAALAGGDALYSEVQTHLDNLSMLSAQIDSTANLKDAQVLQNRIASENGMLSSAMAKLGAMNMNLQANLLNQTSAATQRYSHHAAQ